MRTISRLAATAVATFAAAGGLFAAPAGATETGIGPCTGTSGVTVIVDFSALGGGIETHCAAGDPSSGLDALTTAGFSYDFVPGIPGFVCRIDELPDPCNGAPVDAYWSYWHAQPGGYWSYSQLGGGQYDPAPGSVEGWAFGAGQEPGTNP